MDIRFESGTACTICTDTQRSYDNALLSLTLTVHDTAFALPLDKSAIGILNDFASPAGFFIDAFDVSSSGRDASCVFFNSSLAIQNTAPHPPVPGFDTVELKDVRPPDSSLFTDPTLSFWDFTAAFDRGFDSFSGAFRTASVVTTVPEPSTLFL